MKVSTQKCEFLGMRTGNGLDGNELSRNVLNELFVGGGISEEWLVFSLKPFEL